MKRTKIGLGNGGYTAIDDVDAALVARYNWHRSSTGYARCSIWSGGRSTSLYLHRLLMDPPAGFDVDHIDGDRLNNIRSNLRVTTRSRNAANQRGVRGVSRFRGVSYHRRTRRWHADIKVDGRRLFIGSFTTEDAAAMAYNKVARHHYGNLAHANPVG